MSSTTAAGGTAAPRRGSSILAILQRIGRSLMMPIAALPAAALLLRFGQDDMLGKDGVAGWSGFHWMLHVAPVIGAAGAAIFDHLPIIFAVGVAIGFARKSDGSTALAAVVGYLIFNAVSMTMFSGSRIRSEVLTTFDDKGQPALNLDAHNPTWVLGGIIIGITAALLWQRYYRIKLPSWLAFFGGRRFVPIITGGASLILGVIFGWVWPIFGDWLHSLGNWLADNGTVGAGIYGAVNRALIPFGLHHIVNAVVWFQIPDCGNHVQGDLNCYFAGHDGSGTYMAGFFPVMMFALPAAAFAMWRAAPPHRRAVVGGILLSAGLTSFITGITEPIEFAFIFVAPVLFAVHIVLTGVSMALASALGAKLGFGFSAGLTDMLLNAHKSNTHGLGWLLLLGVIYAAVYYALFTFIIRKFNILTPGREPASELAVELGDQAEAGAVAAGAAAMVAPDQPADAADKPKSGTGGGTS
ncbi:MAG TPA: PTS transporter subunit EIIC [Streptosporangiaceae bacterium]